MSPLSWPLFLFGLNSGTANLRVALTGILSSLIKLWSEIRCHSTQQTLISCRREGNGQWQSAGAIIGLNEWMEKDLRPPGLKFATASDGKHGMTSKVPAYELRRDECLLSVAFARFDSQ